MHCGENEGNSSRRHKIVALDTGTKRIDQIILISPGHPLLIHGLDGPPLSTLQHLYRGFVSNFVYITQSEFSASLPVKVL